MNSPKSDGFQLAAFFAWLGELVLYLCKGMRVGLRWIYHNTLRHYKRRIVVLSKRAYRRGKRALLRFWQRFTAPFHKTADGWRVVRQKMASTKGLPFRQRMSFLSDAMQDGFHTNAGLVRSVVNILLPVAAAVILAVVLLVVCQTNSGVNVIYNGQVIGVVSTEAQANQAIRMVQSRMVLNDGDDPFTFEPTYSIDYVDSTAIMDEYQLADQIIRLSGDSDRRRGRAVRGRPLSSAPPRIWAPSSRCWISCWTASAPGRRTKRWPLLRIGGGGHRVVPHRQPAGLGKIWPRPLPAPPRRTPTTPSRMGDTPSGVADALGHRATASCWP